MTLQEIQDRNKQIAIMLGAATKQMMGANAWVLEEDELNLSFDVFNEKLFSNNGGSGWKIKDLKFHSDWNWLHEAVEFIDSKKIYVFQAISSPTVSGRWFMHSVDIYDNRTSTLLTKGREIVDVSSDYQNNQSKIELHFIAVSDFAKLHNEGKL